MKSWLLIQKNIKLLLRAKASALVVIFAPLLIILVLGLAYNSGTYGLNIGVYSTAFTEDVGSFINTLQEQDFKVVTYDTSIDPCIEDIKLGYVHTCIDVPESLSVESGSKEVKFYLDPSRINLVWMIQETLKSKFDFKSQEISQQLSQDLISTIGTAKSSIEEQTATLDGIKEKSSTASTSTTAVQTSLEGVDAIAPQNVYDTGVVDTVHEEISSAIDKLDDATSAIDDSNLSAADKSTIKDLISDADDKLDTAKNNIVGNGTNSVKKVVDGLEVDFAIAQRKLIAASEAISSSGSSLSSASVALQESVASLDNVQANLRSLQETLNAQKLHEASTVATPLRTTVEKVRPDGTFLNYLFPALLVLVVMFTSLLLGTTLVMMEKNSPAFVRNYFLPLRKATFVFSTYISTLMIIMVQVAIILVISLFFLDDLAKSLPSLFVLLTVSSSVFTLLGMGIGYIFTSEETGILASISAGSILLFISGTILPIESFSPWLRDITFFNPYVLAEKVLRETFLFQTPFTSVFMDVLILLGYGLILFLAILVGESLLHQHRIKKFFKHHHKFRQADKLRKRI
jgi:ABC-type multidrug transport system permease subunit